jgi:hypothetical protein
VGERRDLVATGETQATAGRPDRIGPEQADDRAGRLGDIEGSKDFYAHARVGGTIACCGFVARKAYRLRLKK